MIVHLEVVVEVGRHWKVVEVIKQDCPVGHQDLYVALGWGCGFYKGGGGGR